MIKLSKKSLSFGSFIIVTFVTVLFIILIDIGYKKVYLYIFISLVSLTLLILFDYIIKIIFKYQEEIVKQNKIYEQKLLNEIEKSRILFHNSKTSSIKNLINKISHHWRQKLSAVSLLASGITLQKEMGLFEEEDIISTAKNIIQTTKNLSNTLGVLKILYQSPIVTKVTTLKIGSIYLNNK